VYASMYMYVCVCVCVCVCVYVCVNVQVCECMRVCASYLGILTANSSSSSAPGKRPLKAGSTLNTRHLERMASKAAVRGVCPSPTTTHVVLRSESCTIPLRCSYDTDENLTYRTSKFVE
jgi:hypothetical protein